MPTTRWQLAWGNSDLQTDLQAARGASYNKFKLESDLDVTQLVIKVTPVSA